jgi:hypothetical protein
MGKYKIQHKVPSSISVISVPKEETQEPKQPEVEEEEEEVEDDDDIDDEESSHQTPIPSSPTDTKTQSKTSCLKGIRRDVNAYKELKEERYYDSWIKSVRANAKLHGVALVLDKNYKPEGEEAINDFLDMQTFMWAIAVNTIKTAKGKHLIRENDEDPQKVFALLHSQLKESQLAEYSADDIEDKLKALSLTKWTGTYVSFLDHFSTQLFLWCELVAGSTSSKPQDIEKRRY